MGGKNNTKNKYTGIKRKNRIKKISPGHGVPTKILHQEQPKLCKTLDDSSCYTLTGTDNAEQLVSYLTCSFISAMIIF